MTQAGISLTSPSAKMTTVSQRRRRRMQTTFSALEGLLRNLEVVGAAVGEQGDVLEVGF